MLYSASLTYLLLPEISVVPGNASIVSQIQNALFVLCLDGEDVGASINADRVSSAAEQLLHGGHPTTAHSANRWFDKTLQVNALRPICQMLYLL